MKRILSCAIVVPVLSLGLSGCLGSDGSGAVGTAASAAAGANLPTTPVTITTANAPTVASTSLDTAFGTTTLSPVAVQTSAGVSDTSAVAISDLATPVGVAAIKQLVAQSAAPATVVGATTTTACPVSGSYAVTQTGATSGTMTYTDCSYTTGTKITGTVTVANSGTTPTGGTTGDITLDLTFTSPADTIGLKGDMSIAFDAATSAHTLKGTSLVVTSTVNGNRALQNYTISKDAAGDMSLTFTYASTVAGGTATFATTTPFHTASGGKYPSSGAATVTGASSTMLKITVLGNETAANNSQVQLEVSTDAGVTYGTPSLVTWASFKLTY